MQPRHAVNRVTVGHVVPELLVCCVSTTSGDVVGCQTSALEAVGGRRPDARGDRRWCAQRVTEVNGQAGAEATDKDDRLTAVSLTSRRRPAP